MKPRTTTTGIRLTVRELAAISAAAKEHRRTRSDYMRRKLLGGLDEPLAFEPTLGSILRKTITAASRNERKKKTK